VAEVDRRGAADRLADTMARCGPTAALALDARGRILFVNQALERLLGHPGPELIGRPARAFLHPDDRADLERRGILSAAVFHPPRRHASAPGSGPTERTTGAPGGGTAPTVLRIRDAEGSWRWLEATTTDLGVDGSLGTIVHLYDVTRWRRREVALSERVLHDPLTGAANRTLLEDRLAHALLRGPRSGAPRVAVMFCDLDGFKAVNDTLGHAAGDALLVEAFVRLRHVVRPPDTVARLGGDEFVVLCEEVDRGDAPPLARRMLRELNRPFRLGSRTVRISASIGIAMAEVADVSAVGLMRDADRAMYAAKCRGASRIVVHDDALRAELSALDTAAHALQGAVDHGALELRCLPRVHLHRRLVVGREAQVWWRHPSEGPVPAESFRSVAARAGLDSAITEWALTEAGSRFGTGERRPLHGRGRIWVELGPEQLRPDLVPVVRRALAEGGLPACRLGLSVTGSDPGGLGCTGGDRSRRFQGVRPSSGPVHPLRRGATLGALGRLGVHVSVDDLPGDPAALGVLGRGAVRMVTLPPWIVGGLGRHSEHTAVARGLLSMARSLEIGTHASGVVSPAQADALEELGCDTASGPLFSDPASDRAPAVTV